jgi:curved DNA-binding protein CbpA
VELAIRLTRGRALTLGEKSRRMDRPKDYYSILGVSPTAELVVIRAAYRALALRYHPDTWGGDKTQAENLMRELNEAYEVLSNATSVRFDEREVETESWSNH